MPFQSGLSGIRFRFYNSAVILCRAKMLKELDDWKKRLKTARYQYDIFGIDSTF